MHITSNNEKTAFLSCTFCKNNDHFTFKCEKLLKLPINERYNELKKNNICTNCLKSGHTPNKCNSKSCQICQKRHNTILHDKNFHLRQRQATNIKAHVSRSEISKIDHDTKQSRWSDDEQENDEKPPITMTSQSYIPKTRQIILPTAIINVYNKHGEFVKCRALLDSGSQSNFCTKFLFDKLQLTGKDIAAPVSGISQSICNITCKTETIIKSADCSYQNKLEFLVIDNITSSLPQASFDTSNLRIPSDLKLADPSYNETTEIDVLLGCEIFYDLMKPDQLKLGKHGPILQNTKLGWIVAGPMLGKIKQKNETRCFLATDNLHKQIERFWEIENIEIANSKLSKEEMECELNFRDSFDIAKNRLISLERKLAKNSNLRQEYNNFLKEYEDLGHMTLTSFDKCDNDIVNYLPHRVVIKQTSSTTKVRVVFDASAKTTSGLSLNDVLKVGPKIQSDLFDIVVRMRMHPIVITADAEKMYRMILIHKTQRDFQRILWRYDPNDEIKPYRLNTVTYGTSSASFLATRVLHQVGLNCRNSNAVASNIILRDFYMDDLITGSDDWQEALKIKDELASILAKSGFKLRKWQSNDSRVLHNENNQLDKFQINDGTETRALGIVWHPREDTLHYSTDFEIKNDKFTKRVILSQVARIFDPLGLINPCIMKAKLILQELWQLQSDWDDEIPDCLKQKWSNFIKSIKMISKIAIPRPVIVAKVVSITLHGFSDASQVAYGACIYVCSSNDNGKKSSHLICSKSRVAPIKQISIARLELCGAFLLAQLMTKIKSIMLTNEKIQIKNVYYWTDSSIVLSWLNSESHKWKIFVANRVADIQRLTEREIWKHVPTADNPADFVSRGLNPDELQDKECWWKGPEWITLEETHWPQNHTVTIDDVPEARKQNINFSYLIVNDFDRICTRYSTFLKLQHVMAYLLRFVNNIRSETKLSGLLSLEELNNATIKLCKIVQNQSFIQEISLLQQGKMVHKQSKLVCLNPFLDNNNLIRIGGRLRHSELSYDEKFPIVLPAKHHFVKLIVKYYHHKYLHAGPQFVLSRIRSKFWPLDGRNTVRRYLRNCTTCFRVKPLNVDQLMGDLPDFRVTRTRPFAAIGLDYAGPYLIKDSKSTRCVELKAYLCIFVCLATKAVHLELVTQLTSEAFMNAFKRFVSRRGLCRTVYSDNGTNFVGANNDLKNLYNLIKETAKDENYYSYFVDNQITWHFIPPRSPHFGGLWESTVKSFKFHIKRVLGETKLNCEQFYTLLTQIEAILNSRPILPLSSDPTDLEPLTPGHFLIGQPLQAIPQENVVDVPTNRLNNFKQQQQLLQRFWRVWNHEYLHTLQQRSKWTRNNHDVQIGTMVLLKEQNIPPLQWRLGRIEELYPGQDHIVRVVLVRTRNGMVKRAVAKVCPLPIDED
ncbi:uncharacterized protein [Onthophagus taurus]|uniref:uncharacterized protein n=1 Tax=Onthophagus taurus TaxID=166361 RepID=UPI0039BE94CB